MFASHLLSGAIRGLPGQLEEVLILPLGCDPVVVAHASATSLTFIGLPGHIEWAGSEITFSTSIAANCDLILTQHAVGLDFFGPLGGLQAGKGQDTYPW